MLLEDTIKEPVLKLHFAIQKSFKYADKNV